MTRIAAAEPQTPRFSARLWGPLAAALLAFAVFSATLDYGLVWDDVALVGYVKETVGQGGLGDLLAAEFTASFGRSANRGYYRPVVLSSLWVDTRLEQHIPSTYHLTNVLLHVLATLLVYFLAARLLRSDRAAAVSALAFAANPVHTESVAFISGRTDLWAAVFTVSAALLWLKDRESVPGRLPLARAGSLAAFFLALLSKEVSFALPVVLLCWDLLENPAGAPAAPDWWRRNRAWILLWGAAIAAVALLRWHVAEIPWGVTFGSGVKLSGGSLATIAGAWVLYLRLLLVPWPLNACYIPQQLRLSWLPLLASAAMIRLCQRAGARSRPRIGLTAGSWMVGFLLPSALVLPVSNAIVAERFLYLPSVGIAVLAGYAFDRMAGLPSLRAAAYGIAAIALLAGSAGTWERSKIWRDEVTLFGDMARTSPRGENAFYNLGIAYAEAGRLEEAVAAYREATRINPAFFESYNNMGTALAALGRLDESVVAFRKAVQINAEYAIGHKNLGYHLIVLGRYEEGIRACREALRLLPEDVEVRTNLALALGELDRRRPAPPR